MTGLITVRTSAEEVTQRTAPPQNGGESAPLSPNPSQVDSAHTAPSSVSSSLSHSPQDRGQASNSKDAPVHEPVNEDKPA